MVHASQKPILIWLISCAVLVALMVLVGGLTRLTESGLSITEWKPVSGILPPLTDDGWQQEFEDYKQSPQYIKVNKGMSVEQFKSIFWLEYIHRLLGRVVGLVCLLPLLYFSFTRRLEKPLALKLTGIFLLVGVQGVVGWYMVKSGLVNNPWVSPVRLAFHLCLAFIIFALLLWQILNLLPERQTGHNSARLSAFAPWVSFAVMVQVMLGAFVAGLDAGLTYNSFPLMDGAFIPEGLWSMQPAYINLFENVTMVQFNHRLAAYILTVITMFYAYYGIKHAAHAWQKRMFYLLIAVFSLQILLGIATLLMAVPLILATLHQLNALFLFGICILLQHGLKRGAERYKLSSRERLLVGT